MQRAIEFTYCSYPCLCLNTLCSDVQEHTTNGFNPEEEVKESEKQSLKMLTLNGALYVVS